METLSNLRVGGGAVRVNFDGCQLLGSFAEHQSLELLAITWISVRQVLYSSALAMGKKKKNWFSGCECGECCVW